MGSASSNVKAALLGKIAVILSPDCLNVVSGNALEINALYKLSL
jgi:hypothetical protein